MMKVLSDEMKLECNIYENYGNGGNELGWIGHEVVTNVNQNLLREPFEKENQLSNLFLFKYRVP